MDDRIPMRRDFVGYADEPPDFEWPGGARLALNSAVALRRNPRVLSELVERRCDIVGHGYRWVPHVGLSREEERRQIRRAVDELGEMTGHDVMGWFTRPPNTVHTRELLAEEGVAYDCGAVNDDVPYYDDVLGRPFLVVPYSLDINDIRFWKGQLFTGRDFEAYGRDSFDALYAEAQRVPRMMSIGLHPRIIGRPGRIGGLARLLEYIRGFDGVWIAGRDDIARHWVATFPQEGLWNWDGRRAVPRPQAAADER